MSKQTESSRLIVSSVPGLYQHLLSGAAGYQELGSRVLRQIEAANAFRQTEKVKELARILAHIPIREYQLAGQYHLVLCKCRESEYHADVLERIAEQSQTQKAKALISRGALEVYQDNPERALSFYTEALKPNPTVSEFIKASTGIAIIKSIEGYHASALRDLEKLIPLLKHADPLTYFQMVNSYAVELIEDNRLADAQSAALLATSSPLGPFHPEWRQTLSDVRSKLKRRSSVTILQPLIEREYEVEPEVPENVIDKARVRAAIDFMKANLHRRITRAEIASTVRLSTAYFADIFKLETGIALGESLIRLRMEKASQLLVTTFLSIKEIMAEVGFHNKSNFTRSFRKHFQVTPSEYRKRALASVS
jgi:AraC-like DNA-binding protein